MTEFITIHSSQIREITEKGISYVNESGSEGFIDFEECYQNYLKRWLNQDAYEEFKKINPNFVKTYEEYAERKKKWKEIGRRNVLGSKYGYDKFTFDSDNPYFVFHTTTPTVVECEKDTDQYRIVRNGCEKHGWRTFDMT